MPNDKSPTSRWYAAALCRPTSACGDFVHEGGVLRIADVLEHADARTRHSNAPVNWR